MSNIISKAEISTLTGLNLSAIKEYVSLAENRLVDTLETKKQLEQKAFILFSGYITAALALFGLTEKFTGIAFWLNLTAIVFCIGVIPLFLSMKASNYGTIGRHPNDWLEGSDYLTIKDEHISYTHANMLHDLILRIDTSKGSNDKKATYLNIAILTGMAALLPFFIKALFSL